MKKIIASAIIALTSLSTLPAHADDQQVLAIIDTAINSSKFTNVIQEVCITSLKSCPNKLSSMEGSGSAGISNWNQKPGGKVYPNHGNGIAIIATKVNPSVKIVFIRIMEDGVSFIAGSSIDQALAWVAANASKYSIDAVSISQNMIGNNCTTRFAGPEASAAKLYAQGVAIFASSGNDSSKSISFPACMNNTYSVGGMYADKILSLSNGGSSVKFATDACYLWKTNGAYCTETLSNNGFTVSSIMGTSASAIIVASKMVAMANGSKVTTLADSMLNKTSYTVIR